MKIKVESRLNRQKKVFSVRSKEGEVLAKSRNLGMTKELYVKDAQMNNRDA